MFRFSWKIGLMLMASGILASPAIGAEAIDDTPMPIAYEVAFPEMRLRRPVVITHAGDNSGRLFVVTQQGVIHVFPNRPDVAETQTFLDIEAKVAYADTKNEEGFLGLAFHPNYKRNGFFFAYYTEEPSTSVISRFQVSKHDSNVADPDSEEVLLKVKQPYWNHNGGTLAFGPDGYLYIGLGDGGKFNDPHMNGQNIQSLLGSILRIDVDHRTKDRPYAIPEDNPFVEQPRFARPEIYAYGFRNIWRLSFDRKTGQLWAADVGQDFWEEINVIEPGKNYGWNLREAQHKFGLVGSEARSDLVDPIFEYDHEVGKSITGGLVYRGTEVPDLQGYYLYADYVSGKVWGLKYDLDSRRVTANRHIAGDNVPVITFGDDAAGEVYFSDAFGRIFRFVKAD